MGLWLVDAKGILKGTQAYGLELSETFHEHLKGSLINSSL